MVSQCEPPYRMAFGKKLPAILIPRVGLTYVNVRSIISLTFYSNHHELSQHPSKYMVYIISPTIHYNQCNDRCQYSPATETVALQCSLTAYSDRREESVPPTRNKNTFEEVATIYIKYHKQSQRTSEMIWFPSLTACNK